MVTAVNALQFAEDADEALQEVRRVLAPGGRIAIANWAERELNDLDVVEAAVAQMDGEPLPPDPPERRAGGLEDLLAGGFTVASAGLVEVPWSAADDDALVAGVLLGEDPATLTELRETVERAAAPFRTADGGYLLRNRFRWVIARR